MTDRNKLQALYNYVKLIKPDEDITLANDYIFVGSLEELEPKIEYYPAFFKIFCTDGDFVGYTYSSRPLCPLWLHDVFHVYRTPLDKIKDKLPDYEQKQGTTRLCRRFYILDPKEEGLFSND